MRPARDRRNRMTDSKMSLREHHIVWRALAELPRHSNLILSLAKRELAARYRGSALGPIWAFVTPAMTIAIYTFIFSGIFGARFGASGSKWSYALYLYCGLLPWTALQEATQTSATTIVAHANLVKKVVFPLETLPVAHTIAALGHQLYGTIALLAATLIIQHEWHPTWLWFPFLLFPQALLMFGMNWFIASLGVYVRDVAQALGLLFTAWFFLTPIVYPETVIPQRYQAFIDLNPLTALVRNHRRILLDGMTPEWSGLLYASAIASFVFIVGCWWFARTKKGFADVI